MTAPPPDNPFAKPPPDTAAALDALSRCPGVAWTVGITERKGDAKFKVQKMVVWRGLDVADAIERTQGERNIYYHRNLTVSERPKYGRKALKEEIVAIHGLHLDWDPSKLPKGTLREVARAHYDKERPPALARLRSYDPPPTDIVDTGRGYQAWWELSEPFRIRREEEDREKSKEDREKIEAERREEIEARLRHLAKQLGGDDAQAIVNFTARLPGTLNLPTNAKAERGYKWVSLAAVVERWPDRVFGLSRFAKAAPKATADAGTATGQRDPGERLRPGEPTRKILAALGKIMREGLAADDKGTYKGDRSKALFAVNCALVQANRSIAEITALNLDKANKLTEHVYEQSRPPKYARRQAERAFAAVLARQKPSLARGSIDKACHVNDDGSYWQEMKPRRDVRIEHFWAYSQNESYIFTPDASPWPRRRVGAMVSDVGLFASDGAPVMRGDPPQHVKLPGMAVIDSWRAVQQMTWWPDEPQIIRERLAFDGGWLPHAGAKVFNIYHPPEGGGDPREGERHLDLVRELFATGDDGERIVRYLAHCCQHPAVKINHALLLGGEQGIGKDTVGAGMRGAIGEWNYKPVSPAAAMEKFNAQIRSVMLHISESHEGTEAARFDRYAFYEWLKEITAEPPAMLFVNEKHMPKFWIKKPTGVVITTNHPLNSTYLPPDDRRVDACWSPRQQGWKGQEFFDAHFAWINAGGGRHIAAALARVDLSSFNPHATPFHSEAWHAIVQTARPVQEIEMNDTLDWLEVPVVITVSVLREACAHTEQHRFAEWLADEKNYSKIPMRFHDNGYEVLNNPDRKDGRWKIDAKPQTVYARKSASLTERRAAMDELMVRGTFGILGKIKQAREAAQSNAETLGGVFDE